MTHIESAKHPRNASLPEYVFGRCAVTHQRGALRRRAGVGHVVRAAYEEISIYSEIFGRDYPFS